MAAIMYAFAGGIANWTGLVGTLIPGDFMFLYEGMSQRSVRDYPAITVYRELLNPTDQVVTSNSNC